ncbi:hypothetical protein ACG2K1_11130 [Neisseria sp. 23W00296]|uniref:hypothetical protein n=1 Tax=unclassified Neisseria TaxID=2623750 RepID=UPI0002A1A57D|nr:MULTISPECIES: hypothetical protein [unclassified Neisseria]EKY04240.1 hypothetical protein HMPREF9120_02375 [Neisseria sp. oral taxon 020 str. F0370]
MPAVCKPGATACAFARIIRSVVLFRRHPRPSGVRPSEKFLFPFSDGLDCKRPSETVRHKGNPP